MIGHRDIVLVLGKTGYGKSWWGKLYSKGLSRLLIYDPFLSPEYEVCFTDPNEIYESVVVRQDKQYRLGIIDEEDLDVLGAIAYIAGENHFLCEESALVHQKGALLPLWERRLVFQGRHRCCSLIYIAQRSCYVPIDLRSQANRVVSFSQFEGDDLGWLCGFMGQEAVRGLPHLKKFECVDSWNGALSSYSIRGSVERAFQVELEAPKEDFEISLDSQFISGI